MIKEQIKKLILLLKQNNRKKSKEKKVPFIDLVDENLIQLNDEKFIEKFYQENISNVVAKKSRQDVGTKTHLKNLKVVKKKKFLQEKKNLYIFYFKNF